MALAPGIGKLPMECVGVVFSERVCSVALGWRGLSSPHTMRDQVEVAPDRRPPYRFKTHTSLRHSSASPSTAQAAASVANHCVMTSCFYPE